MKLLYLVMYSLLTISSLHSMQRPSYAELLSKAAATMAYKATSWYGRNDYLYLAHTNAAWYLEMKLNNNENINDINRYYLRCGATFNSKDTTINAPIYVCPLHEAVEKGHLAIVALLLKAGANKALPIKNSVQQSDMAETGSIGCPWMECIEPTDKVSQQVATWYQSHHVGLSACELAKKMLNDYASDQDRKSIYNLLNPVFYPLSLWH